MRLFNCTNCANTVHFDNSACVTCGLRLGYQPRKFEMTAIQNAGDFWEEPSNPGVALRLCRNAEQAACNWLVDDGDGEGEFCVACRHNVTIPDLGNPSNIENWRKIESAKRHLFYSLLRFGLPLVSREDDTEQGLGFEFLADDEASGTGKPILTGHDDGLITLNIVEASDAEREARRVSLGEPFRTLIGHFRHEVGHYYWNQLVRDRGDMERCRVVFGDERKDYGEALQEYYRDGPAPAWEQSFISAYASSHPWEDFAETWAHYFHIVDALETAHAFGLRTQPGGSTDALSLSVTFDPYEAVNANVLIGAWVPLTLAVNSINRSMGQRDLYPFVLSIPVAEKLQYVHDLIHRNAGMQTPMA